MFGLLLSLIVGVVALAVLNQVKRRDSSSDNGELTTLITGEWAVLDGWVSNVSIGVVTESPRPRKKHSWKQVHSGSKFKMATSYISRSPDFRATDAWYEGQLQEYNLQA